MEPRGSSLTPLANRGRLGSEDNVAQSDIRREAEGEWDLASGQGNGPSNEAKDSWEDCNAGRDNAEENATKLGEVDEKLRKQRQNVRRLVTLFLDLARPYWKKGPRCKTDIILVFALGLMHSGFSVAFSYVSRFFMNALQHKDEHQFWLMISTFVVLLSLGTPVVVWYYYAKDLFVMRWREWSTGRLLRKYFADRNYYEIDSKTNLDNPDQRISQDMDTFTTTSMHFIMTVFFSVIDLLNFSVILATIYSRLFVVLIIYAVGGTFITVLIGRRLININFAQLQKEADFRFSLIRVRTNAESIAFYAGYREGREKYETEYYFSFVIENLVELIRWSRNLRFWTTAYRYALKALPYAVVAPLYFAGDVELGVVSQSAQAFHHILEDLSLIVDQFERLSAFSAGVDRLGELEEALKASSLEKRRQRLRGKVAADSSVLNDTVWGTESEHDTDTDSVELHLLDIERGPEVPKIEMEEVNSPDAAIKISSLDVMTPNSKRRLLIQSLNLSLEHGRSLLIVGPSGCGKSSLLRVLAGLWETGRGRISRPASRFIFFLPQKPYCTLGTLREQLVYPLKVNVARKTNEELLEALEQVDLRQLPSRMDGLDSTKDWSAVLSLGEQQRLAFARVILNEPSLCVLDEATSALDVAAERRLYSHLKASKSTYISVGHRPTLLQYHDFLLRINPGGKDCAVSEITEEQRAAANIAGQME